MNTIVTPAMRDAGNEIASTLLEAQVAHCLGGLGGSKDWAEFEQCYKGGNMDLIKQYIAKEIDSVTAIYLAMHRVSGE